LPASVGVWHADGSGLYSAFERQGGSRDIDTTGETFLCGIQNTDAGGVALMTSIYPGW
jgi:protocatechuate 3,4-dioxygenase beta subunit